MEIRYQLSSVAAAFAIVISQPSIAVPQYIEAPPLGKIVNVTVAPVKPGPVKVPFITWGADMATIYANGNDKSTSRDSIFGKRGLDLRLYRQNELAKQVGDYMQGETPYLRGTMGMINIALDVLSKDERTKPVVIYQLSWSTGGDTLVVKPGISAPLRLKGKTIAMQAYGPHIDYVTWVLGVGKLNYDDVKIKWLPDFTGTDNSPSVALQDNSVDAAFMIIPDAMAITSGGTVGTGEGGSIKGATILRSTSLQPRAIADVYAVRSDFLKEHPEQVQKFVDGLIEGAKQVGELVAQKAARPDEYKAMLAASAELLLDSREATADMESLYGDVSLAGLFGNISFFNPNGHNNVGELTTRIQNFLIGAKMLANPIELAGASWNFQGVQINR
ncbi:MAG: hypothetical protein U1F68_15225 [Gammaproteobacteria bacterium]